MNSTFKLVSKYQPMGDQPAAIDQLVRGLNNGDKAQTLLGVTGSGKTFTIANVIARTGRPALVLSHNKTLAAQLYEEFKGFFPENAVEYFVSYYDYYQPEAYIAATDTYIEKDLAINTDLDKLRLSSTMSLMSGRRDIVVVSSVSCLYGLGNPEDFYSGIINLHVGQRITPTSVMRSLQDSLYVRNEVSFDRCNYRVKGDTIDVYLGYEDYAYRFSFWGDEIESIDKIDPISADVIGSEEKVMIFPANLFVTPKDKLHDAIRHIQDDLVLEAQAFRNDGREAEARRLEQRVSYDMEMIKELGYCPGIENYSRYFDRRKPGQRPFCLLDYFPKDFIVIIDESHVTVPQIHAMYGGDRSRKDSLVNYGFRLQSARDNRPLKFEEFESMVGQTIYVSATPADYELQQSQGVIVEQVVRPTGLLDPDIEVRPTGNQIDDLISEVNKRIAVDERTLVTTLTKRMAEELSQYMSRMGISCAYIHSDVDTLERVEIMQKLRQGDFDVLIGVNLLREGLDMPEVSLVAILDADKEGFLRTERSLTQTAGRAARNLNGHVIMYADKITPSMQATIDSTNARRHKQMTYNEQHHITPRALNKEITHSSLTHSPNDNDTKDNKTKQAAEAPISISTDPETPQELQKAIELAHRNMKKASKDLDFIAAAQFRDQMRLLEAKLKSIAE